MPSRLQSSGFSKERELQKVFGVDVWNATKRQLADDTTPFNNWAEHLSVCATPTGTQTGSQEPVNESLTGERDSRNAVTSENATQPRPVRTTQEWTWIHENI